MYECQPDYGTSYIVGKYLLEDTMADYARLKENEGEEFKLKDFFDELNLTGNITISFVRFQRTARFDVQVINMLTLDQLICSPCSVKSHQ
ncbi:MAG: hypothetical protein GY816_16695 [Cytophagales bacterium]|nr:hypothetical protein [Cytophagales bacterium]